MLLNKDYEGLVFSFYSQNSGIESLANKAEIRFAVLSKDQVIDLLYGDGSFSVFMTASDHSVKTEKYDRFAKWRI